MQTLRHLCNGCTTYYGDRSVKVLLYLCELVMYKPPTTLFRAMILVRVSSTNAHSEPQTEGHQLIYSV